MTSLPGHVGSDIDTSLQVEWIFLFGGVSSPLAASWSVVGRWDTHLHWGGGGLATLLLKVMITDLMLGLNFFKKIAQIL